MKSVKTLRIIGIFLGFVFFIALCFYLYIRDFGRNILFSYEPRHPKNEVPITYNIDWWTHQNQLNIDTLNVEIIEKNLSLFNHKSLISYVITGHLNASKNSKLSITEVHISERLNRDSSKSYDRIIEITPIVKAKIDKNLDYGRTTFKFKNEHIINSNQWGMNKIKFICGTKEQVLELQQVK